MDERDKLVNFGKFVEEQRAQKQQLVIESRQNPAQAQAEEELAKRNVEGALKYDRSFTEKGGWCVLLLVNGDYAIERFNLNRANNEFKDILSSEIPLGLYVRSSIVRIYGPFATQDEAVKSVIEMKVQKGVTAGIVNKRIKLELSQIAKNAKEAESTEGSKEE